MRGSCTDAICGNFADFAAHAARRSSARATAVHIGFKRVANAIVVHDRRPLAALARATAKIRGAICRLRANRAIRTQRRHAYAAGFGAASCAFVVHAYFALAARVRRARVAIAFGAGASAINAELVAITFFIGARR